MVLHLREIKEDNELVDIDFIYAKGEDFDYEIAPKPDVMSRFFPDKMKGHELNIEPSKLPGENIVSNISIKKCMPFVDMMKTGFAIPLWHDIFIRNGTAYDNNPVPVSNRESEKLYSLAGHSKRQLEDTTLNISTFPNVIYKLTSPWKIVTPKGWSCLFISPQHRDDIPIKIISGVVDTDKHPFPVNFPFVIDKTFAGTLKIGTPIAQVIPFRRVNSKLNLRFKNEEDEREIKKGFSMVDRQIKNHYRDNWRSKER